MYISKIRYLVLSTIVLFITTQCNLPSSLGEDIVQSEILDIVYIDTVSLNISTVIFDSVATSNSSRHLIGYREDREIGTIDSKAYFKIIPDSVLNLPTGNARYLHTEFELVYDGYFLYDTAQSFRLNFHTMNQELELDDDGFLYNINSFEYEQNTSIGEVDFEPRPTRRRNLIMPVNDDFGRGLFEFAQDTLRNAFVEDFYNRYPGFVLTADSLITQSFIGFSTNSRLVVHYRQSGEDLELVFPSIGTRFNSISNKRSSSVLENLKTIRDDIASTTTQNRAYLNNGIGIALKIEMPNLRTIGEEIEGDFVVESSLVLRPIRGTYNNVNPLPESLAFFEVDKLNRVERELSLISSLSLDDEFDEDTEYRINITDFVRNTLDELRTDEEDAILIRGNDNVFGSTVDRLIIGDTFNEYEAKLELYILDHNIDIE